MEPPDERAATASDKPAPVDPPVIANVSSPKSTPKRKRDELLDGKDYFSVSLGPSLTKSPLSRPIFSFEVPGIPEPLDDGASSPRTHVAHKFRNLALDGPSGGGVRASGTSTDSPQAPAKKTEPLLPTSQSSEQVVFGFDGAGKAIAPDAQMLLDDEGDNASRKRMRLPIVESHVSSEPGVTPSIEAPDPDAVLPSVERLGIRPPELTSVDAYSEMSLKAVPSGSLQKSYPSINRLSDSKSRGRKRTGTPPPRKKAAEAIAEEEVPVVDPVRAALTWHEDEITVYDAQDKDDDGVGLNGIGFRPTPAVAHARAQKRRQQLSEYKKREESEARARRNRRRHEQSGGPGELERKHSVVKVHFSEAEPTAVVIT